MKRRLLALAAAAAAVGVLRAGTADLRRGTASWTTPLTDRDFDVWTVEWHFGGWYFEFVWGWWAR